MHPDWPRLSLIAQAVSGRSFESDDMSRTFGEMLKAVGIEMQREGFVLPEEMKRPHWVFRRVYGALGLDEIACDEVIERLAAAHEENTSGVELTTKFPGYSPN